MSDKPLIVKTNIDDIIIEKGKWTGDTSHLSQSNSFTMDDVRCDKKKLRLILDLENQSK